MNKKLSGKRNRPAQISPQQYMREKARTLPIDKCLINPDWKECRQARIIVSRMRPGGNLVTAGFTVDTLCRGVTEAECKTSITPDDFARHIAASGFAYVETSYNEIHNLIYGAIEFAREAGLNPAAGFALARFALEEDSDRIPFIEHEFGINGRHTLIMHPHENNDAILKKLRYHLGDNFDSITTPLPDESDPTNEESQRYPSEPYRYSPPPYPKRINVTNRFISDSLLRKGNYTGLSDRTISRILSVNPSELASDIAGIILFEIGRTRTEIEQSILDDTDEATLIHSLLILSQIECPEALDSILEIMRQSNSFLEFHLADSAFLLIHALCAAAKSDPSPIEKFLYEPGRLSYQRDLALKALVMISQAVPRRRRKIIGIFRRLTESLPDRLPQTNGCDADFAGYLINSIIRLHACELMPQVKKLFATGLVNRAICGSPESVAAKLDTTRKPTDKTASKPTPPDIRDFNHKLKQLH